MRTKILAFIAVLFLIFAAVAAVSPGAADDNADGRLSDLETRVAALETQVAAPEETVTGSSSNQQSSTSSSSTSGNNAFTASFSGNGDREIELEIDNAGTYQVTVTTSSAFSADLEDAEGNAVPGFPIETDGADTVTVSIPLEPGTYILRVTAPESWNVTVVLLGP